MPFDNVDQEYLQKPKKRNTKGLKNFMFIFGFISTMLDILCFLLLWNVMKFNTIEKANLFQTGWFSFGIISQTLIIHLMRTYKIPFITSKPSKQLITSTLAITLITILISFTSISIIFDLRKLPIKYGIIILLLLAIYAIIIQLYKKIYLRKHKNWL